VILVWTNFPSKIFCKFQKSDTLMDPSGSILSLLTPVNHVPGVPEPPDDGRRRPEPLPWSRAGWLERFVESFGHPPSYPLLRARAAGWKAGECPEASWKVPGGRRGEDSDESSPALSPRGLPAGPRRQLKASRAFTAISLPGWDPIDECIDRVPPPTLPGAPAPPG
jgi:hypothetical protein